MASIQDLPILLLVFSRLDTTRQVWEALARHRPRYLYVVADGPRADRLGEAEKCQAVRDFILQNLSWDCELKTLFRPHNLGCQASVSQGLTWFFEQVPQGIILEDDCLPQADFFRFCYELLDYYKDQEEVWHISGCRFHRPQAQAPYSYHFSRLPHIWGWASWRRAWQHYNASMQGLESFFAQNQAKDFEWDKFSFYKMRQALRRTAKGEINTWDYQWTFSLWQGGGLSIVPSQNLVSNIGIGPEATHYISKNLIKNQTPSHFPWPLQHPPQLQYDNQADRLELGGIYGYNFFQRLSQGLATRWARWKN